MIRSGFAALALLCIPGLVAAQRRAPLPNKYAAAPTTGAITAADLMTRLYIFADDSMMGRQAGTVYHDKATDYIARELARIGLRPAGDSGTYFQRIPLVRRALAENTRIAVAGQEFVAWRDFLPRDNGPTARVMKDAQAIYGGAWGADGSLPPARAAGRVVVITVPRGWITNRGALIQRYIGAAAIVIVSLDSMPAETQREYREPGLAMHEDEPSAPPLPSFLYATRAMAQTMFDAPLASLRTGAAGKRVRGTFTFIESPAPGARNVIAVLPGTDPALRGQYVAIGAHTDHEGFAAPVDHDSLYAFYHVVRPEGADDDGKEATPDDLPRIRSLLDSLHRVHAARKDSIYNGADDDGSGSMGVLEVAEAFTTGPAPRRSILFVWHVGEEMGLLGSAHFTDFPTVPRDSIVAQINIDMIGRGPGAAAPGGGTGALQIIGSRRLSTELGDIVDEEGKKFSPAFTYDYQYDANGHPAQYYCRSDHYMYARYGIPVVFLSTGGHPEYHQVTDEPQYIDFDGLARVSQLVFNTAQRIANLDHRLVVDKPKPDPRGRCVQ